MQNSRAAFLINEDGTMKTTVKLTLLVVLLVSGIGCSSSSDSYRASKDLKIDQPSTEERYFGEKRDFYVFGNFPSPLTQPGDIQIELYRGDGVDGVLVRSVRSSVDPILGVTADSSFEKNYPFANVYGQSLAPDIINYPGGLRNPNNKVLVTTGYYAGVLLGGVTKGFDTDYTDADGRPLEDLTAGKYFLKVTGLSGDLQGQTATMEVSFGLTDSAFGRFDPAEQKERLKEFAGDKGLRAYFDMFPGYFSPDGSNLFEIKKRWMPNNSLEAVNTTQGTLEDNSASAINDFILYNIKLASATRTVEIGAVVANSLESSAQTGFYFYNVGEPTLHYVNQDGESIYIGGNLARVPEERKIKLVRADIEPEDPLDEDNQYNVDDPSPKRIDFDLTDGVAVSSGDEVELFGIVLPISSAVLPGSNPGEYQILNTISNIRYSLINADGEEVLAATKPVLLNRTFNQPYVKTVASVYEFKHDFAINYPAGQYYLNLVALDSQGAVVAGTNEVVGIEVK